MDPAALAARLEAVEGRLAGSDAERRAAALVAGELRTATGRRPGTRALWIRRDRQLPRALYAALGIAGSVVAVGNGAVGLGLAAGALLAALLEAAGVPVASLLQARRATQNVVAAAPAGDPRVLLVIAAGVDMPRDGLLGRVGARLPGRLLPGAAALLLLALAAVAGCAGARLGGAEGTAIGVVQLVPSALLILLLGAFVDAAAARPLPGAPAGGPAAAVAVAGALAAQPPRRLAVEVVVAGASEAGALGMAAHVRARRRELAPEDVVLLELRSARGPLRFATHAGELLPIRLHPRLTELAAALPAATPRVLRARTAARVARGARWPAIALEGEPRALAAAALRLVAAIDAEVSGAPR